MERRITETLETKKNGEGSSGLNFQKSVSAFISQVPYACSSRRL
jgi:hypothetical protein